MNARGLIFIWFDILSTTDSSFLVIASFCGGLLTLLLIAGGMLFFYKHKNNVSRYLNEGGLHCCSYDVGLFYFF